MIGCYEDERFFHFFGDRLKVNSQVALDAKCARWPECKLGFLLTLELARVVRQHPGDAWRAGRGMGDL